MSEENIQSLFKESYTTIFCSARAFRLHAGMFEGEEIPLHRRRISELHYSKFCISLGGALLYRTIIVENDIVVHSEHVLKTPEDFLCVEPEAVEELYEQLMRGDYWENLSYLLTHRRKPGYRQASGEDWFTSLS